MHLIEEDSAKHYYEEMSLTARCYRFTKRITAEQTPIRAYMNFLYLG